MSAGDSRHGSVTFSTLDDLSVSGLEGMFELGGVTVTWGAIVLGLCLVAATGWVLWRRPLAVVVPAVLIAGVHVLAYATTYLDAARLASIRETAVGLSIAAFLAVAGALDVVFAAIRRTIVWLLEALDAVSMPGAAVSVLEFGGFLLAAMIVSALVCGALVRIVRWADGEPLGGWLAGLGVVFGAIGVLWTWLPVPLAELAALHALLVVVAIVVGVALGALATGGSTAPAVRERVRTYR